MLTPTVHLNGTSHDELISLYRDALDAVNDAIQAVQKAAPHARDYYVQTSNAALQATREHLDRLAKLEHVRHELNVILGGIKRQGGG